MRIEGKEVEVIFRSIYPIYDVVVETGRIITDNGVRIEIPSSVARFRINGEFGFPTFITNDEETVKRLQKNQFFGRDFWVETVREIKKKEDEFVNIKAKFPEIQADNRCDICGFVAKNYVGYSAHMRKKHPLKKEV